MVSFLDVFLTGLFWEDSLFGATAYSPWNPPPLFLFFFVLFLSIDLILLDFRTDVTWEVLDWAPVAVCPLLYADWVWIVVWGYDGTGGLEIGAETIPGGVEV